MFTALAPLALVALASLRSAYADYPSLFVGCVDSSFAPTVTQTTPFAESSTDCAGYCYNVGGGPYTYAYYMQGAELRKRQNQPQCVCSNEAPAASLYVVSPDTTGGANCANTQFTMRTSASTYTFDGCYNDVNLQSADTNTVSMTPFSNPQQCLAFCKAYDVVSFVPFSGGFQCACSGTTAEFQRETPQACGPGSFYFAIHEAGTAVSSQFAKRQAKERLMKTRSQREALCPNSLTACRVPGAFADSFECIDTTAELESCGGCSQGFFNDREAANAALGVDCTSLPGVAKGAVTCTAGVCEAFACRPGYTLTNGVCVQV
ncbi:hypothetical protein IAT40_001926 [Kwoniella sp. CBS 6097]